MSSTGTNNILKRVVYRQAAYTAADIVKEFRDSTFEELGKLIEEKNPGISFDLLPPEAKEKAAEKLKAFDNIVKPGFNQKQENHIKTRFDSEEAEFKYWYDSILPNLAGIPSSDPPF